jgi:hypothetical protein
VKNIVFTLVVLLTLVAANLHAQELPEYCTGDSAYEAQLRALGPVATVGASVSSGLWAKPFSTLVAYQMCLSEGDGYEASYSFLFFGGKLAFLKRTYIESIGSINHLYAPRPADLFR